MERPILHSRIARISTISVLALGTLIAGLFATASCCEPFNVMAMLRNQPTTCMGFSPYRPHFMAATLLLLGMTLGYSLYGPGARREPGMMTTLGLAVLAMSSGMLLFVVR